MKIIGLKSSNFKRIDLVDLTIDPKENMLVLGGKNRQGKSSLVDAVDTTLTGGESCKELDRPVKTGTDKAENTLVLSDGLTITRKWTKEGKTQLIIKNSDGAVYQSPQALLDKLIDKRTIDPVKFINMEEAQQIEEILKLLGIDVKKLDTEKKNYYDTRTTVNRDIRQLQSELQTLPVGIAIDATVPDEPLKMEELLAKVEKAQEEVNQNQRQREEFSQFRKDLIALINEKNELVTRVEKLTFEIEEKKKLGIQRKEMIDALKDPDVTKKKLELVELEKTNSNIRMKQRARELELKLQEKQKEVEQLNKKMEAVDQIKLDAIKNSQLPEGLAIDGETLTLNGVPFKQASQAERLITALLVGILKNPKIRVIWTREGSLLDDDSMNILRDFAKDKDFQIWVERVQDDEGIIIEDGHVKEIKPMKNRTNHAKSNKGEKQEALL